MRIILASKSPRRRDLIGMLGLEFEVIPSNVDESVVQEKDPIELVRTLAKMKAEAVAKNAKDAVVIGSDSLVVFQGRVIGKAPSKEEAIKTLESYSGKEHEVITGLCLINTKTGRVIQDHDLTKVLCRSLSRQDVLDYVETGAPLDGAGCYTAPVHHILFEKIEGSWTNMSGLPMEKFIVLLGDIMKG
jgi:septum formation protein